MGKQWVDSSLMGCVVVSQKQRPGAGQDGLCFPKVLNAAPELRVGLEAEVPC